jgi:hypothetical protein
MDQAHANSTSDVAALRKSPLIPCTSESRCSPKRSVHARPRLCRV